MKVTIEAGPCFSFLLRHETGETKLVQRDTDFALLAQAFGWSGTDDATAESTWDAFRFLEWRLGESIDDPGYF